MQNYFKINISVLDIATWSTTQYEPHSINVFAVEFFCIFGVQKFPSLKICLNKFPLTKWGYNNNCIIKIKRNALHFMTDMVKLSSSSCTLFCFAKVAIHPLKVRRKWQKNAIQMTVPINSWTKINISWKFSSFCKLLLDLLDIWKRIQNCFDVCTFCILVQCESIGYKLIV